MKKFKLFFVPVLVGLLIFSGCEDDPTPVNEAQVLVDYLESADSPIGKDYINSADMPSIIKSSDVHSLNQTGDVYIIDIRAADDFTAGHIENAVNVSHKEILSHVEGVDLSGYQKVAVVCYSGQTAGWATSILRIMGYSKAYSMKWGMCSWSEDTQGSWENNIGNAKATEFTTDETAKGAAGNLPVLSTGKTTGKEILEARVAAVLAEGFDAAKVTHAAVFETPADYYVANYWSEAHYNDPGHIPGAMQYTPRASMVSTADLKTLATDKKVAVYCYTGQTSAFMTAYLRILGYDAKSILFGTNGMIYDKCVDAGMTVWNDAQKHDYQLVTD